MASISVDQFICSICLDVLNNPVTIPCGHSYCMNCIRDCWDQDGQKGVYCCPQCRHNFTPRPVLGKNTILDDMVEKLKKIQLQTALPVYAEPGDVECDICTGMKLKAVKSCLVCLESYCQSHFECHEEFHKGKPHEVINATGLQEMICQQHNKQLEIYCHTDQRGICYLCTMDEHKHHDTVTAVAERTEKQKQLEITQRNVQDFIRQRECGVQKIQDDVKSYRRSAQTAVRNCEMIFTELISSIERSRCEMTRLIRDQERAAVNEVEERLKQLKQEINDLRRTDAELEKLLRTRDHIHFLQNFQSFSDPGRHLEVPNFTWPFSFDDVRKSVSLLREKLEDFCKEGIQNITGRALESQLKTSAGQEAQPRFFTVPKVQPRPSSVALEPKTSTIPKSWATSTKSSEPQLRTSTLPESQPRTTAVPKVQPRPSSVALQPRTAALLGSLMKSTKESQPMPNIIPLLLRSYGFTTTPKPQFRTSTAPEAKPRRLLVEELKSKLKEKNQYVS